MYSIIIHFCTWWLRTHFKTGDNIKKDFIYEILLYTVCINNFNRIFKFWHTHTYIYIYICMQVLCASDAMILWHVNPFILLVGRLVVWVYGISTIVCYLMPNLFLYKLSVLFQTIQFSMSTQFNCQKYLISSYSVYWNSSYSNKSV